MKKIVTITLIFVFCMVSLALATADVSNHTSSPVFSASSKVTVMASANATVFAALSKHLNGTRMFGTASDSTKISYKEDLTTSKGPGYILVTGDLTKSDSTAFSGYTTL